MVPPHPAAGIIAGRLTALPVQRENIHQEAYGEQEKLPNLTEADLSLLPVPVTGNIPAAAVRMGIPV